MKKFLGLILLALSAQSFAQDIAIIPAPSSVVAAKGTFTLNPETNILVDFPDHKAVKLFTEFLKKNGYNNTIVNINATGTKPANVKNAIVLQTTFTGGAVNNENYELKVTENQVVVNGKDAGLFYGIQSLMQMMTPQKKGYATIPCATIKDAPRFIYRGMHLDVSRHFYSVDFIKKYLDVMAMYKLNTFHWHLTDDQGWRIEIKKYPKLTQIGSTRAQTKVGSYSGGTTDGLYDNTPYSVFYTQDQVKEIVAYAAERFINVIPEIEMPGHSVAAISAYPILSCDPSKSYKVAETWGVFTDVYCPTDTTFRILNNILDEVMEMFPSKYIHIGGDECPKDAWKKSGFCQQLIKDSALRDEAGLQSYFIRRIERHINAMGRRMIGWDEILEGGVAPNATIMSWRGENGGIAAAQLNHDVIMTPGSGGLYFDHAQSTNAQEPLSIGGDAPLSKTYNYEPVPSVLNADQAKHIIGVQANLWTEYIAAPAKAEFHLLPRMLALSEIAWTPAANKNYKQFSEKRVPRHLAMLESKGYNYRVPDIEGVSDTTLKGSDFKFEMNPGVEGAHVYYTIDGHTPRETDMWYTEPLRIKVPAGKKIDFQCITITPGGKRSNLVKMMLDNSGQ